MKLAKKIALAFLVLCFVFQFNSCSYFSESDEKGSTAKKTKPKKENLETLETKKQDAVKEINDFKVDIANKKSTQENLGRKILEVKGEFEFTEANRDRIKKKCETLVKVSEKVNKENSSSSPANPSRPSECNRYEDNEDSISNKQQVLLQAETELKSIETQIVALREKQGDDEKSQNVDSGWLTWLLIALGGGTALGLIGILAYFLNGKIIDVQKNSKVRYDGVRAEQNKFSNQINQLNETAKLQSDQLTKLQTTIQALQKEMLKNTSEQKYSSLTVPEPAVYKPEPKFPVAAEDYLTKNRSSAQTAAVDHYTKLLVRDASKGDEFLIVKDDSLAHGLVYAVPNVARFSTKGDYLTYYQNYYDCDNPSGGTVWIKYPTTVQIVTGGWKLVEKGELEIR